MTKFGAQGRIGCKYQLANQQISRQQNEKTKGSKTTSAHLTSSSCCLPSLSPMCAYECLFIFVISRHIYCHLFLYDSGGSSSSSDNMAAYIHIKMGFNYTFFAHYLTPCDDMLFTIMNRGLSMRRVLCDYFFMIAVIKNNIGK